MCRNKFYKSVEHYIADEKRTCTKLRENCRNSLLNYSHEIIVYDEQLNRSIRFSRKLQDCNIRMTKAAFKLG